MSPKKWVFLLLLAFLPIDGTDLLRLPLGDLRIAPTDLLLVVALFLDFLDATVTGIRIPRFALGTGILSFLIAISSAVSLLYVPGVGFEYDVKMTLVFVELLAVLWLTVRTVDDLPFLRSALTAVAFGAALVSLTTVAKSAGFDVPGEIRMSARWRIGPFLVGVSGLEGAGLSAGMVLLAALPAALVPRVLRIGWLRWPLAGLLAFAGVLVYSRSLWVALAVQVAVLIAASAVLEPRPLRTTVMLLVVAGLAGWLLVRAPDLIDRMVRLRPQTVASRIAGYEYAIDLATGTPLELLFGAGKGFFAATFSLFSVPHNFMLDILVSKGLLSLLGFLALLAVVGFRLFSIARRHLDPLTRRLAVAILAALVGTLANGLFEPITTSLTFLVVVAFGTALASLADAPAVAGTSATPAAAPAPSIP